MIPPTTTRPPLGQILGTQSAGAAPVTGGTNATDTATRPPLSSILKVSSPSRPSIESIFNPTPENTPAPEKSALPEDTRNFLQKALDFTPLPAVAKAGYRAGQAFGDLSLKAADFVSGGAVDRYFKDKKGMSLDAALSKAENTPDKIPVLGNKIRPIGDETPETITGDAIKTVSYGAKNPVAFGLEYGVGSSMSEKGSPGQVALNGIVNAIGGKILEHGFNLIAPYVEKAAIKFGQPFIEKISQFVPESGKDFLKNLSSKVESVVPNIAEKKILPSGISNAIEKTNSTIGAVAEKPFDIAGDIATKAKETIGNPLSSLQNRIARSNAPETLPTSIDRLHADAQKPNLEPNAPAKNSPIELYDKYAAQEAKFKGDVMQDTAIGKVGSEDLGPAYEKVAKMRRDAGELMGSEMKRVGTTPTDITEAFPKFEQSLNDSGVTYRKGKVVLSTTSKITQQDANLLNTYIGKLNNLGPNPTAAELDAFLSKTPKDLNVYKAKNNITGTTDGERMIKQNLRDLSKSLTKKANPEFSVYQEAKAKYADLSNFLKQGEGFVGKKTSSGDYAKDASILKSAIQSILNGGKKDWLIRLEELTGNPIVDKAMLALQAMKDAGNFRGNSLLDILSPKQVADIPTSAKGVLNTIVNKGIEFGKKEFVGSPAEQTRRIIQERMAQGIKEIPSQFEVGANSIKVGGKSYTAEQMHSDPNFRAEFDKLSPAEQAKVAEFERTQSRSIGNTATDLPPDATHNANIEDIKYPPLKGSEKVSAKLDSFVEQAIKDGAIKPIDASEASPELVDFIRHYGVNSVPPIEVDAKGVIRDGIHRFDAFKFLGIKRFPVKVVQ